MPSGVDFNTNTNNNTTNNTTPPTISAHHHTSHTATSHTTIPTTATTTNHTINGHALFPLPSKRADQSIDKSSSSTTQLNVFCTTKVPYFTPLGGNRPDAAVVACVAVWEEEEEEAKEDVILPPDVLDTTLGMLCSPLKVKKVEDLRAREAYFDFPTASIRLYTLDAEVEEELKKMTTHMPNGGLSVMAVLGGEVTRMRDNFMEETHNYAYNWQALGGLDLRRTSLESIGSSFLEGCRNLTTVTLPPSLTEVGDRFLRGCTRLQRVDMGHTALQTVGRCFANFCDDLSTVVFPDRVAYVGGFFLLDCGHVEVKSESTAVKEAAEAHHEYLKHRGREAIVNLSCRYARAVAQDRTALADNRKRTREN